MKVSSSGVALFLLVATPGTGVDAFVLPTKNPQSRGVSVSSTTSTTSSPPEETKSAASEELLIQKRRLFALIGKQSANDSVLADPITKEAIQISAPGVLLGGETGRRRSVQYIVESPSNTFQGSSDTYIDLLEPVQATTEEESSSSRLTEVVRQVVPYIPFFLRGPLASLTGDGEDSYIPMRDLFTSPAVSFAYERGWRQGFAQAGFPGADVESEMAMDYFAPVVARATDSSVVVDMSCATGLFTRRFAATDNYSRVLGCDYSESMLTEARRRITAEPKLSKNTLTKTQLDLVRLDVGQIPMQDASVDCLHAGAAMHCWPDLNAAAKEIYRVLKPGGRYFATTFLSQYFSALSAMDGSASTAPSQQTFQYFESVDTLRSLLEDGGFEREKIQIEILGAACVVIRAEK